jgi:Flp pilus assembly pilin Flp
LGRPYKDLKRLKRLPRDERGTAAVEFALLAPVLLMLAAGAIDVSRLIAQTMQVRAAAQAGADYALKNGVDPWDPGAIQGAVTAATPLAVTPVAAEEVGCASGSAIVPPPGPLCAAGGTPGTFVNVDATASFTPIVPWNAIVLPAQVRGQATVRVS